jgi:hypothetical protein
MIEINNLAHHQNQSSRINGVSASFTRLQPASTGSRQTSRVLSRFYPGLPGPEWDVTQGKQVTQIEIRKSHA